MSSLVLWDTFPSQKMDGAILFLTVIVFSFLILGRITYVFAWWTVFVLMMWERKESYIVLCYSILLASPIALVRWGILYLESKIWR